VDRDEKEIVKGDLRCVGGDLYRHDPQLDDPSLETYCGICPDCGGQGCEPPVRVVGFSRMSNSDKAILVSFTRELTDDEMRDFHDYTRNWDQ